MTIWYLMRACGLVALLAFSIAVGLGALSTVGWHPERRLLHQLLHRSIAGLGVLFLVLHLTFVVLDTSVPIPVGAVLLPFTASFRPLAVGLGTLAMWAMVLAVVSGLARGALRGSSTETSERTWRILHGASYVGWALSIAHGVLTGTDTGTWWTTATYALCALTGTVALTMRWRRREPRRVIDRRGHLALVDRGTR